MSLTDSTGWRRPRRDARTAGRLHADCATVSGKTIGPIAAGGCLEPATLYLKVVETRSDPRHSH